MSDDKPIPEDEWRTIVANVPLVSVDLVVRHDGGIVLGKRRNEPAKGEWFLPGGTVLKNERLEAAVHRIARGELGSDVSIVRRLGTYEHIYDTAEVDGVDGKHYLSNGFLVELVDDLTAADDQHDEVRVFDPPFPDLHPYVEQYLAEVEF